MRPFEPLNYEELSPGLKSVLPEDAPLGLRMAAASGGLPMMTAELVASLYYLANDEDRGVRRAARKSLVELPDTLLATVLASPVSPKILHWFSTRELGRTDLYERILLNRNTADETFERIAEATDSPDLLELIAHQETRYVRRPEIIEKLANNPNALTASVQRAEQFFGLHTGKSWRDVLAAKRLAAGVLPEEATPEAARKEDAERAERERLLEASLVAEQLPEGFTIEKLAREEFDVDELFAEDLLLDPEAELEGEKRESLQTRINKMSVLNKMRLALKGNIEARNILIKSANRLIQECVMRNPRLTIEEVIKVSKDKTQREEIIRMVAHNKDWTRHYPVVVSLTWNPKTPIHQALKYLDRLNPRDLISIARSKQVPGMVAVQARKIAAEKQRFR
ncbi:hypothetical protein K8I61_19895 [bacterium]|nr:hypothetical protein [bacterium]